MQQKFHQQNRFYLRQICILINAMIEYQMRKQSAMEIKKSNREIKTRKKERKLNLNLIKKPVLKNKRTRKSQTKSNTSNSKSYTDQPHWIEASS